MWDEDLRHLIPVEQGSLRELMKLVEKDESQWKLAAEAHAGLLSQRNMHEDAAVAYLAAKLPEQALASYRAAGQWQMAFALAGEICPPIYHSVTLAPATLSNIGVLFQSLPGVPGIF